MTEITAAELIRFMKTDSEPETPEGQAFKAALLDTVQACLQLLQSEPEVLRDIRSRMAIEKAQATT